MGLAVCAAALLLFSGECFTAAREAAEVFASGVMPALFPMMVLAGCPGAGAGAKGLEGLWGRCFSPLGRGPGGGPAGGGLGGPGQPGPLVRGRRGDEPLFFLGHLGGLDREGRAMGVLLGIHWAGALLTAALARG